MPSRLRERPKPKNPHIRDLLADDARVIATEGFQPFMSSPVERGRYFLLSDPLVRQHPQFFAVVVPVSQVFGEIER